MLNFTLQATVSNSNVQLQVNCKSACEPSLREEHICKGMYDNQSFYLYRVFIKKTITGNLPSSRLRNRHVGQAVTYGC